MIFRVGLLIASLVALVVVSCDALAGARTTASDGAWDEIVWLPTGPPEPESDDTIVVNSAVTSLPVGSYSVIVIQPGASLDAAPGVYVVDALVNHGTLRLRPGAVMKVRGDIVNSGVILESGALEMTRDSTTLSGGGPIANLVLNAGPRATFLLDDSLALGSLYITGGVLLIDANDLRVDGRYSSATPLGDPGIDATTGLITLNGPVHGSARGPVRLGWVTGGGTRKYPTPPTTYGRLGDDDDSVRFSATRIVSYSEILGTMIVDSGAVVTASGIGTKGINTVRGGVINNGTMTARDAAFIWRIEGDLRNRGTIDDCTVMMIGHDAELTTDSGSWGWDASLIYRAGSGGTLQVVGSITAPRLEISTLTAADSGVTVAIGPYELVVRHRFTSDQTRGCRLLSDSVVRVRKDADGIIEGDVSFEGFFDARIAGVFGATGRTVRLSMPKRFNGPLEIIGTLLQTANARLTIGSSATLPSGTILVAELTIDTGGVMTVDGNLTLLRGMRGGGTLEMIGSAATLDVSGPVSDSLLLRIGRDTMVTALSIPRSFTIARMTIHPYSTLVYPPGVRVDVTGEFRHRIAVTPGYALYSAALRPADTRPTIVFPGANTPVFRLDQTNGYVVADSIRPGEGYWISFPTARIIEQRGTMINPAFASTVFAGWNIIGALSVPVEVADMVNLQTVRLSDVFEYGPDANGNQGYLPVTTMEPGRGYLVQYQTDGTVVRTKE